MSAAADGAKRFGIDGIPAFTCTNAEVMQLWGPVESLMWRPFYICFRSFLFCCLLKIFAIESNNPNRCANG